MTSSIDDCSRRRFVLGSASLGGLLLGGCTVTMPDYRTESRFQRPRGDLLGRDPGRRMAEVMYGPVQDSGYTIPAVDLSKVDPRYYRREVAYSGPERPGTVIVDTASFFLYLVLGDGRAMRYGVGLGRAGFEWSGRARIAWKQKWPKWTPPDDMIARQPELAKYSADNGGMEPGLKNPLGARALYIFQGEVDTLYRIHGTPEYWTIGKAVSSGCVRMMNQDVIDLYDRAKTNVPIIVR